MEVTGTRATIGSDAWKNASIRNIRLSHTVVNRSDKACDLGQQLDPLPSLRDTSIQQSNARIHAYVRATRAVLVKLRESFLDTNEEIKSLQRGKQYLERTLEHIRKDIILNTKSTMHRQTRPLREKVTRSTCLNSLGYSSLSMFFEILVLTRGISVLDTEECQVLLKLINSSLTEILC